MATCRWAVFVDVDADAAATTIAADRRDHTASWLIKWCAPDGDETIDSYDNLEYVWWQAKILTDISPEGRARRI